MPRFRVARTDGEGLRVRSDPGLSAPVVGLLTEGTIVDGQDGTTEDDGFHWRRITSPQDGFVADEFLDPVADPIPGVSGYVFPVEGYTGIVQLHWGSHIGASDLFAPHGTPVLAMRGGRVSSAGTAETDQYGGNNVLIRGDDGLTYYYAHGDRHPQVSAGQTIPTGTFLFGVNETGNAAGLGDHLHIGIGYGIQDGTGPAGGAGIGFNAVELLTAVLNGAMPPRRAGRSGQFRVIQTGHLGLNVRSQPSHSAPILTTLQEGAVVEGEDTLVEAENRIWRRIHNPEGYAADQFLAPVA
jgi:murein DD-endopeptidase MepM/ murein hydrolase activator NlpD